MHEMRSLSAYVNLIPALAPRSPTGGITMAKNKNRKQQGSSQNRSAQPEEAQEQRTAQETHQSPMPQSQGGSSGAARRQQKRFGHN
ncbi:hypothetical protein GT031_27985 [Streptomyces sp. SID2888]|nr:hypothetical protein [Streptomyces sp. SID2888]